MDHHASADRPESSTEPESGPCTKSWDTDPATVSQSVGHRELGHNNKEEVVVLREQQRAREGPLPNAAEDRLVAVGVTPTRATALASRHPIDRIDDVLAAVSTQPVDNPAGWIVTALDHGWDIDDLAEQARQQRRRRDSAARQQAARQRAQRATSHQTRQQQAHSVGWANVAARILDDEQMTCLIQQLPTPDASRRDPLGSPHHRTSHGMGRCSLPPPARPRPATRRGPRAHRTRRHRTVRTSPSTTNHPATPVGHPGPTHRRDSPRHRWTP